MPMRNECTAPTFNTSNPRELPRFFEDLETLMARAAITSEIEKKKHAVKYVDLKTEQIWKTFPEYISPTHTYAEFKSAILEEYPGATDDLGYSIKDIDFLISKAQHKGLATMQDLSDFHLQFMAITHWLISKKYLADLEQRRAYVRAFQPHSLKAIMNRLAITKPDHHPCIPYSIKDVYEAARFILQGSAAQAVPPALSRPSSLDSPSNNEYLRAETFVAVMADFTKTMNEALSFNHSRTSSAKNQQDSMKDAHPNSYQDRPSALSAPQHYNQPVVASLVHTIDVHSSAALIGGVRVPVSRRF